jgi:hypothetical protein
MLEVASAFEPRMSKDLAVRRRGVAAANHPIAAAACASWTHSKTTCTGSSPSSFVGRGEVQRLRAVADPFSEAGSTSNPMSPIAQILSSESAAGAGEAPA